MLSLITLHIITPVICFGVFVYAFLFWRRKKREIGRVSNFWQLFTFGFLFLGLGEVIDIYTPIARQTTGGIDI